MKYLLGICLIALGINVKAQDFSLYQLRTLPQNIQVNPAFQPTSDYYIGGGIIPFPFVTPINLSVSNGFAMKDVFQPNPNGGVNLDMSNYIENMPTTDKLMFKTQLDLLNFGFKIKKHFFSLTYQERIEAQVLYSKSLFEFAWNGNGSESFLGDTVRVSNFGADVKHYSALKLGYSMKVDDKLTIGATPTIYFGKGYISSKNSYLDIYTSDNYLDALAITPYLEVQASGADFSAITDSTKEFELDPLKYALNYGNIGLGIDLGAQYKIDDQISVSFSIIDLGFLNWGKNASTYTNGAKTIEFTGVDINDLFGSGDGADTSSGSFIDTMLSDITSNLTLSDSTAKINTGLPTKIFMGANYQFNDKLAAGVLLRHTFNNGRYFLAASFQGNVNLSNRFSAVLSYNIMNNSFNNVGIGTAVNMGPVQFYAMMDNVLGFTQLDYTKNMNVRLGFNIRPSHHRRTKDKYTERKTAKSNKKSDKGSSEKASKEEKVKEEKKDGKAIESPKVDGNK